MIVGHNRQLLQCGVKQIIVIDNDDISIMVNDSIVQRFDAEGNAWIPSLSITNLFDLLGFLIDRDENGNINCEYIGGET